MCFPVSGNSVEAVEQDESGEDQKETPKGSGFNGRIEEITPSAGRVEGRIHGEEKEKEQNSD